MMVGDGGRRWNVAGRGAAAGRRWRRRYIVRALLEGARTAVPFAFTVARIFVVIGGGIVVEMVATQVEQPDGLVVQRRQIGQAGEHVLVLLEEPDA